MKTRMFVYLIVMLALGAMLFGTGCEGRRDQPPPGTTVTATPTYGIGQPPPRERTPTFTPTPTRKPPSPDNIVSIEPVAASKSARSMEVKVTYQYVSQMPNAKIMAAAMRGNTEPKDMKRGQAPAQSGKQTVTLKIEYSGAEIVRTDQIAAFLTSGQADTPFVVEAVELNKMWATAQSDDLKNFQVKSQTPNSVKAQVDYSYLTRHGSQAKLQAVVFGDDASLHWMNAAIEPAAVQQGKSGTATITITFDGYKEVKSDHVLLGLVGDKPEPFYVEEFALSKTWTAPPRDKISVEDVKEIHAGEIEVTLKYTYASDHGNKVELAYGAYKGNTELHDFNRYPIPPSPLEQGKENKATFRIRYDGAQPVESEYVKFVFREIQEGNKPFFYDRDFDLKKTWIKGARTITGPLVSVVGNDCNDSLALDMKDETGTAWRVQLQNLFQCPPAIGTQVQYTGIPESATSHRLTDAVKGADWLREVWGDAISQDCANKKARLRDPKEAIWAVTFTSSAECPKFALYDFVGVKGTPILATKIISDATYLGRSSPQTTLAPFGSHSITDETGLDLAAQISRTMLQGLIHAYYTKNAQKFTVTGQNLTLGEPTLNFYASQPDRLRLIINVTGAVSFSADLEAKLNMPSDEAVLRLSFASLTLDDVLVNGQPANVVTQVAMRDAAKAVQEHMKNTVQNIPLPLNFVAQAIGKHTLISSPESQAGGPAWELKPKEWRVKVVPTNPNGDGWLFVGATVLLGTDDKRGYGYWSSVYDFASPSKSGAVAISNKLMDAILQSEKPRPIPKGYALPPSATLSSAILDVVLSVLIVDSWDWGYEPGQLVIRSGRIDLYKIDCPCFDDPIWGLDEPTVSKPGKPGDRAYTHGFDFGDLRALFTIPDKNNPVLTGTLKIGPQGYFELRGDIGGLFGNLITSDGLVAYINAALALQKMNLLNLSFDLSQSGLSGKVLLNELVAAAGDTILRIEWKP